MNPYLPPQPPVDDEDERIDLEEYEPDRFRFLPLIFLGLTTWIAFTLFGTFIYLLFFHER